MFSANSPIIVGVSGGADSICLSSILNRLGFKLIIAHINHNLRGEESKRDEDFVKNFAAKINSEFELMSADVDKIARELKISTEMAGRNIRYDFCKKLSQIYHTDYIAVAHNKNDSAETILLNIIRGASLNGQKGIMPINGTVYRPLIEVARSEIEEYLSENNIPYVTDSTNNENIYTRNIIRHSVIKTIEEINPNIINTLLANAKIISDDNLYLDKMALNESKSRISECNNEIMLELSNLDISIKRRLILFAIKKCTGTLNGISSEHIDAISGLENGKRFILGNTLTVRNNCGKLSFIVKEEKIKFYKEITVGKYIYIEEINKTFKAEFVNEFKKDDGCFYLDYDKAGSKIFLRNKKEGDKFSPLGINGTQSVKDYFINNKISYYERAKIPLIMTADDDIIGIFPKRINKKYAVTKNTVHILKITEIQGEI